MTYTCGLHKDNFWHYGINDKACWFKKKGTNYSCLLLQKQIRKSNLSLRFFPPQPHEEVFGNLTSVELSNSGAYFWNCSARLELTSLNGLHNYEVRFAAVVPNWRPAFTVRIGEFHRLQKSAYLRYIIFGIKLGFRYICISNDSINYSI